jgi:hypothetical protein
MSTRLEVLAVDKQMLVTRSALCRLRLRRSSHELRVTLDWKRVTVAAASASVMRPIAFGLALSFVGAGRAARVLKVAAGAIVLAKLARFVIGSRSSRRAIARPEREIGTRIDHSRTTCAAE